jgi:site-specific DNA-methyltransferase (adenine-specific)
MAARKKKTATPEHVEGYEADRRLELEYVPREMVELDPENANDHPDSQVEELARAMVQYGNTVPMLVKSRGNGYRIVAGEARYLAADLLQLNEVPIIRVDYLSAEAAAAYAIFENKIHEESRWNIPQLTATLRSLNALQPDLLTGFKGDALAHLITQSVGKGDNGNPVVPPDDNPNIDPPGPADRYNDDNPRQTAAELTPDHFEAMRGAAQWWQLEHGDCLDWLPSVPSGSVDLVATDPPYFGVKAEEWDNQWKSEREFLEWLGIVVDELARVLKPTGSLYLFAGPHMAWAVEGVLRDRVEVINRIHWRKDSATHRRQHKEGLTVYFPQTEALFFCGHDNNEYDILRGQVFEPLRAYLDSEWKKAGLDFNDANEATGSYMAGHYFTRIQWALPSAAKYSQLRERANRGGKYGGFLPRDYDDLREEYMRLLAILNERAAEVVRPFAVTNADPYTDVWDFDTVHHYEGKHPTEKPMALARHVVKTSSRPGQVVLDPFTGSGPFGIAAVELGRMFIGSERDKHWHEYATDRLENTTQLTPDELAELYPNGESAVHLLNNEDEPE